MTTEDYQHLFRYLYLSDRPQKAGYTIGFGHFDMAIPERVYQLFQKGMAGKIIFSGGIGAGTADLKSPEADAFYNHFINIAKAEHPDITLENQSTNTAENMTFTLKILQHIDPSFNTQHKVAVNLVASPYRQRRVYLTAKKYWPGASLSNCPPIADYITEKEKFKTKGLDLDKLLEGELDRIVGYAQKQWIYDEPLPKDLVSIYNKI